MQTVPSPSSDSIYLDDRQVIHATDENGVRLLHEETGKPIQIARDLISGLWFAKLADSIPFNGQNKARLGEYLDAGAVHVAHANGRFRGVWFPCGDVIKPKSKAKANA
jgi:hypothetical protein